MEIKIPLQYLKLFKPHKYRQVRVKPSLYPSSQTNQLILMIDITIIYKIYLPIKADNRYLLSSFNLLTELLTYLFIGFYLQVSTRKHRLDSVILIKNH